MTTPVIFRKFKDGDIIALFPCEPADLSGLYCQSYMHVGQHSGASYFGVCQVTKLATPAEYAELLAELVKIGYDDLKVYKIRSSRLYDQFLNAHRSYWPY